MFASNSRSLIYKPNEFIGGSDNLYKFNCCGNCFIGCWNVNVLQGFRYLEDQFKYGDWSLAIFSENVSSLDASVKTVETNTKNQEIIKDLLKKFAKHQKKASNDIASAEEKYTKAIKLGVKDTELMIKDFAENTHRSENTGRSDSFSTIGADKGYSEIFEPEVSSENGELDPGDNIVTYKQFQLLEEKVDRFNNSAKRACG